MAAKGYAFFENGEFNLNIIGVRNSDTGKKVTNAFDDKLIVAYKQGGGWVVKEWPATCDNGGGTARLVPNQYRGSHAIGLHQGKYEALKQCGPVTVYRDFTKDGIYQDGSNYLVHRIYALGIPLWGHGSGVTVVAKKEGQSGKKFLSGKVEPMNESRPANAFEPQEDLAECFA